ncbi:MAG: hypothetical protein RL481_325 [Pseudomonadota bacterium]
MTDPVVRAAALREAQDIEGALKAIQLAVAQAPNDPRAVFGLAQLSFESWRPAADLFARAQALVPGNPDIVRNHALALAAEGQDAAAEALMEAALRQAPGWLDGHRVLAAQRITSGGDDGFDRSFAEAVKAEPANAAIRMLWFQQHSTRKDWGRARAILQEARAAIPNHRGLQLAELYLASESGEARDDPTLFDAVAELGDPGLDLCRVRHYLQGRDPERAEAIAVRHIESSQATLFWPYLSLCWRLNDDQRAAWLDGDPLYSATYDLDFTGAELAQLAEILRNLHRMKAPYPEQSVRGGTQTDRQLFFHPDPLIQKVRASIAEAIEVYRSHLPTPDPRHPLLGPPRDQPVHFAGSWSVRLAGGGHHSSHTHVQGWVSSAFYVALPPLEEPMAGQLALGTPPPELDLPLAPYRHIEPRAGRLVLFPSTLWHCTEPFAEGERLTIAFDVKLPLVAN